MDITQYGAENAEAKEIARENDKKLGSKTMFRRMKLAREVRNLERDSIGQNQNIMANPKFADNDRSSNIIVVNNDKRKNLIDE